MQIRFSTFLQATLLIFTIFGWTVFLVQSVYAKENVKKITKIKKGDGYIVEKKDVLAISVFEEPDLSLSLKVAENGTIAFPLIGEAEVRGLSTYEIEQKLEKLLIDGGFLIHPKVSVKLDIELMEQHNDKVIFVIGAVKVAGPITVLGKYITVLEAISMAGGFTEIAAPNRTTVTRIEDGEEKTTTINLNKVKKGDMSLDILLKTGDIVNVPESYF